MKLGSTDKSYHTDQPWKYNRYAEVGMCHDFSGLASWKQKQSRIVFFQFYELGNTSSILKGSTILYIKNINFVLNFYKLDGKCLQDALRVKM